MMPALPRAAFKVIEANLFFEFAVVHLDAPSTLRETNKAAQSEGLAWHLREPEFLGRRGPRRPFHQAVHRVVGEAAVGGPAMRDPDLTAGESRLESAAAARPPADSLPTRGWQRTGHIRQVQRRWQLVDRCALARSPWAATRRNASIGRLGPDLRGGFHLDAVRQVARAQRLAKLGA